MPRFCFPVAVLESGSLWSCIGDSRSAWPSKTLPEWRKLRLSGRERTPLGEGEQRILVSAATASGGDFDRTVRSLIHADKIPTDETSLGLDSFVLEKDRNVLSEKTVILFSIIR